MKRKARERYSRGSTRRSEEGGLTSLLMNLWLLHRMLWGLVCDAGAPPHFVIEIQAAFAVLVKNKVLTNCFERGFIETFIKWFFQLRISVEIRHLNHHDGNGFSHE